jgi:hypothetical protein
MEGERRNKQETYVVLGRIFIWAAGVAIPALLILGLTMFQQIVRNTQRLDTIEGHIPIIDAKLEEIRHDLTQHMMQKEEPLQTSRPR